MAVTPIEQKSLDLRRFICAYGQMPTPKVSGPSSGKAAINEWLFVAPRSTVKLFERLNKLIVLPDCCGQEFGGIAHDRQPAAC